MIYGENIEGLRSGRLVATSYSHETKNNGHAWNCICDCGNTSVVGVSALKGRHTLSCGCLRRDSCSANAKHGLHGTPIYMRWASMKQRCDNPKTTNFEIYGGRGITYDPAWKDFDAFYRDMSEGFRDELELDRIDVNGNYCKENCRWTTHEENNYNKTIQSNNISGKTGVSFDKRSSRLRSYINFKGKRIELGKFITIELAVRAREETEIKYYGYNRD